MNSKIDIPVSLKAVDWSDERRRTNLQETLDNNPHPKEIWVFGYGSLIWDPRFLPLETRPARLIGHRRSFCFWTTRGRGTPERPGLGLAIEPDGELVQGLAYKLNPVSIDEVLEALWLREMGTGVYHAEWLNLETTSEDVTAIVFVANHDHPNYCGDLPLEEQARIISGAKGPRGWSYEYLGNLVKEFHRLGIRDKLHCNLYDRILEILAAKS